MATKAPARPAKGKSNPVQVEAKIKAQLDAFDPKLYGLGVRYRNDVNDVKAGTIRAYWNLAQGIVGYEQREKNEGRAEQGRAALARAFDVNENYLRAACRLYAAYPTVADLAGLTGAGRDQGFQLTWMHIVYLVGPGVTPERRDRLVAQCIKHGWTAKDLEDHLSRQLTAGKDRAQNRGGRKPSPIRSIGRGMVKLQGMHKTYLAVAREHFTDDAKVDAIIAGTPADAIDEKTVAQVEDVEKQLDEMLDVLTRERDQIRRIRTYVAGVVSGQPAEPAPAAAAEPAAKAAAKPAAKPDAAKPAVSPAAAAAAAPRARVRNLD